MAAIGLLHGVNGKQAQSVDGKRIERGIGKAGVILDLKHFLSLKCVLHAWNC